MLRDRVKTSYRNHSGWIQNEATGMHDGVVSPSGCRYLLLKCPLRNLAELLLDRHPASIRFPPQFAVCHAAELRCRRFVCEKLSDGSNLRHYYQALLVV